MSRWHPPGSDHGPLCTGWSRRTGWNRVKGASDDHRDLRRRGGRRSHESTISRPCVNTAKGCRWAFHRPLPHNICITSRFHPKVARSTHVTLRSAAQTRDLYFRLAFTRRRPGVRVPQRPPRSRSSRASSLQDGRVHRQDRRLLLEFEASLEHQDMVPGWQRLDGIPPCALRHPHRISRHVVVDG
jgi:hypothetical protein